MTDPEDTPPSAPSQSLIDLFAADLPPPKPKAPHLTPDELATMLEQQRGDRSWRSGAYDEPEELRLWRRIGRYRDYLAVRAEGWARFVDGQREGHRRITEREANDFTPEQLAARQEARDHGNAYAESARDAARANLDQLDAQIAALRGGKASATYTLGSLRKIADGFHDVLVLEAQEAVRAFMKAPDDPTYRFLARSALLAARDSEPRVLDMAEAMERAREDETIDLDSLLDDARADRVAKNQSHDAVARKLVAVITGTKPHARVLRR